MTTKVVNAVEGKRDTVVRYDLPDFQHTALGRLIISRLVKNRDLKVIITSSGSTTGTGKTTLAIHICRWVRRAANDLFDELRPWDAERDAFLDVWPYLGAYREAEPGDALLLDEAEIAADRRRSMAEGNVKFSQAWAKLRVRNVVTVITLPTVSMLDSRLEELADVWINVRTRGKAHPYYLTTSDFPPRDVLRFRMRVAGFPESIEWTALDGDSDFQYLADLKDDSGVPGVDEPDHLTESDLKEELRTFKKDSVSRALNLIENGGITSQTELAAVLGIDQSTVSKYKREMESE